MQEYYEEKPILDFYTSVVADVLAELANPTPVKKHLDDELNVDSDESLSHKGKSGKKIDKKKFAKQIKALAKDVVGLERALMRAGADM